MMDILQVIPYFSPRMGGAAHAVYHLSGHLSRRGHCVTVAAGESRLEGPGFNGATLRTVRHRSWLTRWGFYLAPGLWAWARDHLDQFDVIHLHEVRTFHNQVVRRFARRKGVPYVLSAHGTLPVILQRRLAKRLYDRAFGRAVLEEARRLIAVSPLEVEQYRRAGIPAARVRLIYNGLNLEEFSGLPPRGGFRQWLGIGLESRIVLFLGRLHRGKGLRFLIEAFVRLCGSLRDSVLVLAGPDAGELLHLQRLAARLGIRDRVRFVEPLFGQRKLSALVDADVVAAPSAYEIFGLVPFEALLCGAPVVVTEECGSVPLLREAGTGSQVPYGDVEGLAAALFRTLTDREGTRREVEAGQAYIREKLGWGLLAANMEDLYCQVVEEDGHR